jgi:hypothetical protein
MSGYISKSKGPTGIVPVHAEHDHWAFMVDGLVVWSGTKADCERRLNIAQAKLLRGVAPPEPSDLERAIRAIR